MNSFFIQILFVCGFCVPTLLMGQDARFGVAVNGGVSRLASNVGNPAKFSPSGRVGFFYKNTLEGRWSLKLGFQFNYIRSVNSTRGSTQSSIFVTESTIQDMINGGGGGIGVVDPILVRNSTKIENELGYACTPIELEYGFKNIAISFGLQPMWLSFAGSKSSGQYKQLEGLSPFIVGPIVGFELLLNQQFSLSADACHGLTNVAASGNDSFEHKIRQYTLGLNYYLIKEN